MDTRTDLVVLRTAEAQVDRFDRVSMALHWATVLLIVFQLVTAFLPHDRDLLVWHRSAGSLTLTVVLARMVWRALFGAHPPLPRTMNRPQQWIAHSTAVALYALLLIQPLSGLADAIFHGRPFVLFGLAVPPLVERDKALSHLAGEVHEYAGYALIGLIVLHVLAALAHGLILRDGVLGRMLPFKASRAGAPRLEGRRAGSYPG